MLPYPLNPPPTHNMEVVIEYEVDNTTYNLIERGIKTVEMRLYRGRWTRIQKGQYVRIRNTDYPRSMLRRVIYVTLYSSFETCLMARGVVNILPPLTTVDDAIPTMNMLYPKGTEGCMVMAIGLVDGLV